MSDAALRVAVAPAARRVGDRVSPLAVFVLLTIATGLIVTGSPLLGDPDTQWHIAVGRQIWADRAVPTTDLYSHTFAGAPWIAKEWVSQLILFGADAFGGWRGVVLVTAVAIGSAFALLFAHLEKRLRLPVAAALTLVVLVMTAPHMLARPHMLVLPVIVAWVSGLCTARERGRAPPLALALLMTLWVNMHGSFPLGLVLAGGLALEAVIATPPSTRTRALVEWGLFGSAAVGATLVSPYGVDAVLVPLRMEGNAETLKYVEEWAPLHFDALGIIASLVASACLVALLPRWRENLVRLVLIALLAAMMGRHMRFISLFGMVAMPLVATSLARWPRLAPHGEAPPPALWGTVGVLAAMMIVAVAISRPAPAPQVMPAAAYQAAVAAGVKGPVLNDYNYGGFLVAHGVKTFVDGRTDQLFLGDFLPAYMRALTAKDDGAFSAILAKYRIAWALVRTGSAETRHLSHLPGWTQIHADKIASVYTKR